MSMPATTAGLVPDPVRFTPKRGRFMQSAIDPGIRHLRQTIRARLISALGVGTPVRGFLRIRCDYLECLVHNGMPQ